MPLKLCIISWTHFYIESTDPLVHKQPRKLDLLNALSQCYHLWFQIGEALQVSNTILQDLKCRGDLPDRKCSDMLQCWMDKCPDAVSWGTIAAALETEYVNCHDIAKTIRRKYM